MTTDPATTFEAATDTAVRLAAGHAINVLRQRLELAAFDENPRRSPAINAGAGMDDDKPPRDPGEPDQPNRADPVGEEALRPSRARSDQRRLMSLVDRYDRAVEDIVALCERWKPMSHADAIDEDNPLRCLAEGEIPQDILNQFCNVHLKLTYREEIPIDVERYNSFKLCRSCGDLRVLLVRFEQVKNWQDTLIAIVDAGHCKLTTKIVGDALGLQPHQVKLPKDGNALPRAAQNVKRAASTMHRDGDRWFTAGELALNRDQAS